MTIKEFAEWLETRKLDTYSCSILVRDALLKLNEVKPSKMQIFMITEAYEAGVGKGHQAVHHDKAIENPWGDEPCREAWNYGYAEGIKQALLKESK